MTVVAPALRRGTVLLLAVIVTCVGLLALTPRASAAPATPARAMATVPATTSQVVSVQAQPGSSFGTLVAWQRQQTGTWTTFLGPVQVRLGSRGLGPAREGSSYTPEGTYPLTESFGRLANPGTSMPYFRTDALDWWDGEVTSPTYNRHVRSGVSPGGASENLYRAGAVYDLAVNIGYNLNPTVPGGGSAFFVHITDGNATAGCVALSRSDMTSLLTWLDPAQNPQITLNTGTAWTPPAATRIPADGTFFRAGSDPRVYRAVGGAPVYIDDWSPFVGHPLSALPADVLSLMRSVPADGTFVATASGGRVHRYVGGAAVYVDSWTGFGGQQPYVTIPDNAVAAAGWGPWAQLRRTPADGTFVATAGEGRVHRYVGGAAVYVDSWAPFGGVQPYTSISRGAVTGAGWGPWSALRRSPADGSFIAAAGHVYRYAGGAALYINSWAPFGGDQPYVEVSGAAVTAAGMGPWADLRRTPADGTFVAAAGHVYRFSGGSPQYVPSWTPYGGPQPYVEVTTNNVPGPS